MKGLLVTVGSRQCLDMIVGKIENGLVRGFVKHRLNCLLITDPTFLISSGLFRLDIEDLTCHDGDL